MSEDLSKAHTFELTLNMPIPLGTSSQPDTEDEALYVSRTYGTDIIEPPEDLRNVARFTQSNSSRRGIIEALVCNTVGLGYSIDVDEGHERQESDDEETMRATHSLEQLARRDRKLHRPSLTELLSRVKWDEEECGNGYLEVSRSRLTGHIDGLFYLPGPRMRRLRDRDGWILLPPDYLDTRNRAIRFYNFGEKVKYDSTGQEPQASLEQGRRWARNEVIPFQLITSESVDYGLPRDIGMALEYAGDKVAAETNLSFFDASGTPPMVIFVSGEVREGPGGKTDVSVPANVVQGIGELIRSDGGAQKRVGVIPLPPGAVPHSVELGRISDRDVGFNEYRKGITNRQLGNFRISPVFVSLSSEGRYTAEVERSITLEQVFDPDQRRWENRIKNTIYRDLGISQLRHKFKRLAIEGDATRRESARALADKKAITNREFRFAHGLGPLPEAPEPSGPPEIEDDPITGLPREKKPELPPGLMPFGWNDQIVDTGENVDTLAPVPASEDNRGMRPGIGGREPKKEDPKLNGRPPIAPVPAPK